MRSRDIEFPDEIEDVQFPEGLPDPVELIADAVISRVLQGVRIQEMLSKPDSVFLLQVRQKGWIEPLKKAWLEATNSFSDDQRWGKKDNAEGTPVGLCEATEKLETNSSYALKDVRKVMARCAAASRPCVIFTGYPKESYVPEDILLLVDYDNLIQPTTVDVQAAYRQLGGEEGEGVLEQQYCYDLTPWACSAAFRSGMSARKWLDRVFRLTMFQSDSRKMREAEEELKKQEKSDSDSRWKGKHRKTEYADLEGVKPISELHGMGEFSDWAADLIRDMEAYRNHGLPWEMLDRGVLLSGPPGVGKTSAVRSLAVSLGCKLVAGSYSVWLGHADAHQGTLLQGMRQSFRAARELDEPCILFIDEVDCFGCRDKGADEHHKNWVAGVVGGLLQEIDGVQGRGKIIVIGATNRPNEIDSAILRPGRLDKHVQIGLPDMDGLAKILRSYLGTDCPDADLLQLGCEIHGATGADVEQIVRHARRYARHENRAMRNEDLYLAVRGVDCRTPGQLFRDGVHEAGHAVIAELVAPGSVESANLRVTARRFGGVVLPPLPECFSAQMLKQRIRTLLGGRAADIVINKEVAAGAGGSETSDLALATYHAVLYVNSLGMSKEAGIRWRGQPRIQDIPTVLKDHPDAAAHVEQILAHEMEEAVHLVKLHEKEVVALALTLAKAKSLNGDQVRAVIEKSRAASAKKAALTEKAAKVYVN